MPVPRRTVKSSACSSACWRRADLPIPASPRRTRTSLRPATPGLVDMRPGDANEVVEVWRWIMQSQHDPVALILSRQNLPTLDRSRFGSAEGVAKGAYVLAEPSEGEPDVILIATGSEIAL